MASKASSKFSDKVNENTKKFMTPPAEQEEPEEKAEGRTVKVEVVKAEEEPPRMVTCDVVYTKEEPREIGKPIMTFSKTPENAPEVTQANKSTPEAQNAEFGQNTKAQKGTKEVFSFRAFSESVEAWKMYAAISNSKMSDVVTAAMTEYISNHPLTEQQKKEYQDAAEQTIKAIKEM